MTTEPALTPPAEEPRDPWALLQNARGAARRLTSILIANAHRLDEARRGYVWVNHVEYARDVPLLLAAYERVVAERDEALAIAATCACGTSPETYAGPEPDCPVHGAVRAFNEERAENVRLRSDLNQATAVVEAAIEWRSRIGTPLLGVHADLIAAIDAYRAAPTGGVEG